MKQFFTGNKDKHGAMKIVNLKNVSNIGFLEEFDRSNRKVYKIIFNYNYSISLNTMYSKKVSDYTYVMTHDKLEYEKYTDELSRLINEKGWIAPRINGEVSRLVNPDCISFVATDSRKNRVILNLAASVSYYNNTDKMTSDFLYFDFSTLEEFQAEYLYIQDQLDIEF